MATQTTGERTDNVMIQATGLTHFYGPQPAIEDVNFRVRKERSWLFGPNGAGKTTTMRILTGFIPPTKERSQLADYDVWSSLWTRVEGLAIYRRLCPSTLR